MSEVEINSRLMECGVFILDPANDHRFREGKLLIIDRRNEPLVLGTCSVDINTLQALP